jgi:hypothetical protein
MWSEFFILEMVGGTIPQTLQALALAHQGNLDGAFKTIGTDAVYWRHHDGRLAIATIHNFMPNGMPILNSYETIDESTAIG